jgi:hypothetical protein
MNRTRKASGWLGLWAGEQLVKHPLTFLRFFLVGPRADLDFYSRDGVYLSFRVYMGETHLVRTKEQTYRIGFPERIGTTLRQPDIIEFALLDELCEGLDRFFDGHLWIHSRAFEEVEFFEAF